VVGSGRPLEQRCVGARDGHCFTPSPRVGGSMAWMAARFALSPGSVALWRGWRPPS
jgi:hypothetical protein